MMDGESLPVSREVFEELLESGVHDNKVLLVCDGTIFSCVLSCLVLLPPNKRCGGIQVYATSHIESLKLPTQIALYGYAVVDVVVASVFSPNKDERATKICRVFDIGKSARAHFTVAHRRL